MSRCRSCGAAVVWITSHATGKALILDAEIVQGIEDPAGRLRLVMEDGRVVRARPLVDREPHVGQAFVEGHESHWAHCPHAKAWRR